jgi:glucose-6-phosphate isomerase
MARVVERVTYDPAGIFLPGSAVSAAQLTALAARLHAIRSEITGDSGEARDLSQPDSGLAACQCTFRELPERILDDYVEHRQQSDLGRILQTARWIRDRIDRIVVVADGSVLSSIRALLEACCEPYFNHLTRSQRGGRPRMLLAGADLDNDTITGLIALLTEGRSPERLEDRWALLLVDAPDTDLPTKLVGRHLLRSLRSFYRNDSAAEAEMVLRVITTGNGGWISDRSIGLRRVMAGPDSLDERFRTFSAVGLLPAAIAGMDIVRLLEGASTANDHFRTAPVGANSVLDFVGVNHLWRALGPTKACGMRIWATALQATVRWYAQLRQQQMGRAITANGTDQDGRSEASSATQIPLPTVPAEDVLWTEVIVAQCRCDPLMVGHLESDPDGLNVLADRSQPDLVSAAICETVGGNRQIGRPAGVLRLAELNEHSLGQVMQMAMLAVAVEQRLSSKQLGLDLPGTLDTKNASDFAARFLYDFR